METKHTVEQGECFSSIAKEYGFLEKMLWNYPANAELKAKRKNSNVLMPNDIITIPDKDSGEEQASTEQKHVYKVKEERVKLQIHFLRKDEPRAGIKFSLIVGGQIIESKTDGDGWLREKIPAAAKTAKLLLIPGTKDEEEYELLLGHLDPIEEDSGVNGRLSNLGFFFGSDEDQDEEAVKYALEGFQNKNGLTQTGEADAATINKLKQIYSS